MAASPSTTPVSAVPTELLQHVLSFLPLEDRLHACCTSKAFEEACTGLALANVSLSMATLRRAHALQGRNWRPAKSLVVRWFHKHGEHIHSLTIRDVIKPFSDDDGPALLLPHCRMLTQLKLQRCSPSSLPLIAMCTHLESVSLTMIPDALATSKSEADLQWLQPLAALRSVTLECPPSNGTACTFVNMAQLPELQSVTIVRGQAQQLDQLPLLPHLTEVHLPRFQGSTMPSALAHCHALQTLSIELHNVPIRNELDIGCLANLHALTSLTITTSNPARLCVPSLRAVRAALPGLTDLHINFCNCQIVQSGPAFIANSPTKSDSEDALATRLATSLTVTPTVAPSIGAPQCRTPRFRDNRHTKEPPCRRVLPPVCTTSPTGSR